MGREQRGKGTQGSSWWCIHLSRDGFQSEGFWGLGCLLPPPFGPSQILLVSFPRQYLVLYQDLLLWVSSSHQIGKEPNEGKDCGQEEKGAAEDEMVGWHHWLKGLEFEQAQGAWRAVVYGVAKSRTRLSNWTTTNLLWDNSGKRLLLCLAMAGSFGQWFPKSLQKILFSPINKIADPQTRVSYKIQLICYFFCFPFPPQPWRLQNNWHAQTLG